jgi:zinc-ribbon domain
MYCPNCGKENPEGRRYCRSCGLSLQAIAPTLAGEPPIVIDDRSPKPINRFQAAWQNPFIYALLLIVLGIIIGVVGERPLRSQTARDIGSIIALMGVGLLGLKGVMMIVAPPRRSAPAKGVTQAEQTSELKRALLAAEPPSVTENTTRQLDASAKSLKERSRDTQPTQ